MYDARDFIKLMNYLKKSLNILRSLGKKQLFGDFCLFLQKYTKQKTAPNQGNYTNRNSFFIYIYHVKKLYNTHCNLNQQSYNNNQSGDDESVNHWANA